MRTKIPFRKKVLKQKEFLLIIIFGLSLTIISVCIDYYRISRIHHGEMISAQKEVNGLIDRYHRFLDELVRELRNINTFDGKAIHNLIKLYYQNANDNTIGWVNIVFTSYENQSDSINQAGIIKYKKAEKIHDIVSVCHNVLTKESIHKGILCIEQSFKNLADFISHKMGERISLSLSDQSDDESRIISFGKTKIHLLLPKKSLLDKITVSHLIYISLGVIFSLLLSFIHKRLIRNEQKIFRKYSLGYDHKIQCLEFIHELQRDGKKAIQCLTKKTISHFLDYFYDDTQRLNLTLRITLGKDVEECPINIVFLQKILMSFMVETINRITHNGTINIQFEQDGRHYVKMIYTDNVYHVNIEEAEDKNKKKFQTHFFYLSKQNIMSIVTDYQGQILETDIKYRTKETVVKFPIVRDVLSKKIIPFPDMWK